MRAVMLVALLAVLALTLYVNRGPLFVDAEPRAEPSASMSLWPAEEGKTPMRVLFVGNSFSSANDMPLMIRHLAEGQAQRLEAVLDCPGGCTLRGHWEGAAQGLLANEKWDRVVLQEQSQLPSFDPNQVAAEVFPYARKLYAASRGRALFFETWAYRNGDRDNRPRDTYTAMQERLCASYEKLAAELNAPLAPVGRAWAAARASGLDLWGPDGKHPNIAGSYLAACVLFRKLYGANATGNPYTAGLDANMARRLQQIADQVDQKT